MSSASSPPTPPDAFRSHVSIAQDDLFLLDFLIESTPTSAKSARYARRHAAFDPLLMIAASASGPHVTRHHYHHKFFPSVEDLTTPALDWANWVGDELSTDVEKPCYVSRQAPRSERFKSLSAEKYTENETVDVSPTEIDRVPSLCSSRTSSVSRGEIHTVLPDAFDYSEGDVEVKCMVRTRIPTPHGPAFLHLYHNNRDSKEHLAIVIDPAQLDQKNEGHQPLAPFIRSKTLDAVWSQGETEMDRLIRGAYVGKLSESIRNVSSAQSLSATYMNTGVLCQSSNIPDPLVRIHSECFTGETIGSMRCDCGEQLDEAIRLISQPVQVNVRDRNMSGAQTSTIPGRGAVVYMRQEGRGIGLLSKLRAYNLQDMGHDTVSANLMLGHAADERGYEVAAAILRDLGLAGESKENGGVRLLTNNPDKVIQLEKEGVKIIQRVPMVPRAWRCQGEGRTVDKSEETEIMKRASGATLIGAGETHGEELEKYLRTKILRMGHMLSFPSSEEVPGPAKEVV